MKYSHYALIVATAVALTSCGGVNHRYVVDEHADPDTMLEAIHEAALARGLNARHRPGREVRFPFDREAGTWLAFQAQRRGIVLVVNVDEELPPGARDEEVARGEEFGRALLEEARAIEVVLEGRRQAEAMAYQEQERQERERHQQDRERREEEEAENAARRAELEAFMAGHQSRPRQSAFDTQEAPAQSSGGGASAHCCVNGQFYSCPSAAAVDRCSGAFMRCVSGCGMSCIDQCMRSDPPDPSACTRDASRDSEC